ncbi:MAG: hypothetical protein ABF683_06255 [Sporolactobacillus sp.]
MSLFLNYAILTVGVNHTRGQIGEQVLTRQSFVKMKPAEDLKP